MAGQSQKGLTRIDYIYLYWPCVASYLASVGLQSLELTFFFVLQKSCLLFLIIFYYW